MHGCAWNPGLFDGMACGIQRRGEQSPQGSTLRITRREWRENAAAAAAAAVAKASAESNDHRGWPM